MTKTFLQHAWDAFGMPFRLALFPQDWLPLLGWTTLEEERVKAALPWIHGQLLDIGAGHNSLVRTYGRGVGVDVFDWGRGAMVVEDTSQLPFSDACFDTVSFLACLNHIPNRRAVLKEARRLCSPHGRLIVTMIDPVLGGVGHLIWWYGEDRHRGGMQAGEVGGLWNRTIVELCADAGFRLHAHKRFVYGLNNLLVFDPV